MTSIDTNVSNYTLSELMAIVELQDLDRDSIIKNTNQLIKRFKGKKPELSVFFQRNAREICLGAMVSVTVVRVTSDLSLARVFVSVFGGPAKEEVYALVGEFKFERNDLHITEELKQKIIANCKGDAFKTFGDYEVREVKTTDGWKYFFDNEKWMMIRASGTEPVLRTYAEAPTLEEVRKILSLTEQTICN